MIALARRSIGLPPEGGAPRNLRVVVSRFEQDQNPECNPQLACRPHPLDDEAEGRLVACKTPLRRMAAEATALNLRLLRGATVGGRPGGGNIIRACCRGKWSIPAHRPRPPPHPFAYRCARLSCPQSCRRTRTCARR